MDEFSYKNYTSARDAVWDLLLSVNVSSLPIDVILLARELNIKVLSYKRGHMLIKLMGLSELTKKNEGLAVRFFGKKYIFYDDTISSVGRKRFTIAHEIGHFCMAHNKRKSVFDIIFKSKSLLKAIRPKCVQRSSEKTVKEREADAFAARLLAPACVLNRLEINSPEDIMKTCGMSNQASKYRFERLQTLKKRNCFYVDEREKAVEKKFEKFILDKNKAGLHTQN